MHHCLYVVFVSENLDREKDDAVGRLTRGEKLSLQPLRLGTARSLY